ncbi:MAG: DUF1566 domain-containing protein [Sulfuricurvum sp.]|uniref:Lcl C-terminal domain-containing protein n=1 Tax=Sulfuricurvum sp. TaxID=2025608 RepID=UPI0025D003A3|nr:DUF1566 domain-containing protein [Sulfuricurvum sp.]MCK9372490.1 DUF1566 domain-containing protein [Sulfuricurvum sp.]
MRISKILPLLALSLSAQAQVHLSSDEHYSQEQAYEYCRDLGPSWRMMSISELYALPKTTLFQSGYSYWSSDKTGSDKTEIGTGSEGDGGIIAMVGFSFYPKERNITLSPGWKKIAAACRDEPETQRNRNYRLTPEGTLDPASAIVWHPFDATDKRAKYTQEQAKEMCENLTLSGRTWRLPSTDELYGIVDYDFTRPTVNMKFFGPMMHRYYWTADSLNEKEGYVVGFKLGSVATVSKKESAYARCVSDNE